jgi:hypothetical protein
VRYSFIGNAADAECGGYFGGLEKYITFRQQVNGELVTMWGWSGRDEQNRCTRTGGTVYGFPAGRPVANLCSGLTGLLFQDLQFLVTRGGVRTAFAAFDVYID